jgi:hypothetical protein
MAKSIIAHPAQESTTRIERGRKLYAEHGDQIWFDRRLRRWIVPSENDGTSVYEVMDPDHLTFFEGDALCQECAGNHGIL